MKDSPMQFRRLRILIVEDEPDTVKTLTWELKRAVPVAEILSAGNVAEGEERLRESLNSGHLYDVAILDFKLPPDRQGENPAPDHSLGVAFRRDSPQTLVVHVTAYKEHIGLKEDVPGEQAPAEKGQIVISKESGWMQKLPKEILRGVPAHRIRRDFDSLFDRRRMAESRRTGQQRWAMSRSNRARSLAIAEFCAYASKYWELLSDQLRGELRHALGYASDNQGNHYLGVVEARSTEDEAEREEDL